jgi:hypothetical protein
MSVFNIYAPTIISVTDPSVVDRKFFFPWEIQTLDQLEVYLIDNSTGTRERAKLQTFRPKFNGREDANRLTFVGGSVQFPAQFADNISSIAIERNTLIDQTIDWPNASPFNGRTVEAALDKLTMICQEMVQRKCSAVTSTPITQEITWRAYDEFSAEVIDFAMDKMADILLEISSTAQDCRSTPENT